MFAWFLKEDALPPPLFFLSRYVIHLWGELKKNGNKHALTHMCASAEKYTLVLLCPYHMVVISGPRRNIQRHVDLRAYQKQGR